MFIPVPNPAPSQMSFGISNTIKVIDPISQEVIYTNTPAHPSSSVACSVWVLDLSTYLAFVMHTRIQVGERHKSLDMAYSGIICNLTPEQQKETLNFITSPETSGVVKDEYARIVAQIKEIISLVCKTTPVIKVVGVRYAAKFGAESNPSFHFTLENFEGMTVECEAKLTYPCVAPNPQGYTSTGPGGFANMNGSISTEHPHRISQDAQNQLKLAIKHNHAVLMRPSSKYSEVTYHIDVPTLKRTNLAFCQELLDLIAHADTIKSNSFEVVISP